MRKLAILGSTGSIGTQALDVAWRHRNRFEVSALLAYSNSEKLFEEVRKFRPALAGLVIEPEAIPEDIKTGTAWIFGKNAMNQMVAQADCDDILVSVVGIAGLQAVMASLARGLRVLLANKEPLVAGG